jgi:hypothetical protein
MKTFTSTLALAAIGAAMLAAPALAQGPYRTHQSQYYQSAPSDVGTYPNGAAKTGSAESEQDGADFNLNR